MQGLIIRILECPMSIYLCRWTNGDVSIVSASNIADALKAWDEFANADDAVIARMPECSVSLRLNDLGELELGRFGDNTHEFIMETCYPKLAEVLANAEHDEH